MRSYRTSAAVSRKDVKRFTVEKQIQYSDLQPLTRHLLQTMWSMANSRTGVIPRPELARRTGMNRRTVIRHADKAVEAGWLIRSIADRHDQLMGREANRYLLTTPVVAV